MDTAVKKTISLPPELAREAEDIARATRLKGELRGIQGYWSRKAKEKGVLTEKDLERYLGN
jgi:hypothetical protein